MKPEPLSAYEQQLLNQRGIVETVIGHLKHHDQIWHTRHRSLWNAMTHLEPVFTLYFDGRNPWIFCASRLIDSIINCAAMLKNPGFPPRQSECEDRF